MSSRMDRYYQNDEEPKRTSKNDNLYHEIYNDKGYDQVDNDVADINASTIATLDVGKQLDIRDVQAILQKRNETPKIAKEETLKRENIYYEPDNNKSYDVNDMLKKAHENTTEEYRPRSLAETQVLTLQELINNKDYGKKSKIDKSEMKDLINTIYSTNMLKKDDGGGLLDDLKSTGNTTVSPSIKEILEEKKQEMQDNTTDTIDKSFFTSSLGFKKSDFETINKMDKEVEDSNRGTTIFLIILGITFICAAAYIIYKYVL